jgi:hypothetical protein
MANTHMGQPPSNHVTLEAVGVKDGLDFIRITADGTREPSAFRVPAGKVFVVTDVDWQYNSGAPQGRQTFRIFILNLAKGESWRVFESTVILNGSGDGGISEAMTSGFVVSSKGRIHVDVSPGGGVINHIIIRGYLCRE